MYIRRGVFHPTIFENVDEGGGDGHVTRRQGNQGLKAEEMEFSIKVLVNTRIS